MAPYNPPPRKKQEDLDALWYLQYYEAPPYLKAPPYVLGLPNELLALIASRIANNSDLRNLSLVCKRLREVAQRSLLRPVRLPENGIQKLLEMLFERMDLANRITHVDLGDYKAATPLSKWDEPLMKKCEILLAKVIGLERARALMEGSATSDAWGEHRTFYLAVLWALLPKLKSMTVEMPSLTAVRETPTATHVVILSFMHGAGPSPPFHNPLVRFLEQKLENLTISETSSWKGSSMRNITVANFELLRHLSLPIDTLVRRFGEVNDIEQVLPPSLEELSIRSCNKYTCEVLDALKSSRKTLVRLQRVGLYFKTCVRSSLLLVCLGNQEKPQALRNMLQTMKDQGICVRAFCRTSAGKTPEEDRYAAANLPQELEAWAYLSLSEVIMASNKGLRFSEIAARKEDNQLRTRSKAERVLFLRTYHILGAVFTSPSFKPELWLKTRFFFGPKKSEWGHTVKNAKQDGEKKKKGDEKDAGVEHSKDTQKTSVKTPRKTRSERSASPPLRSRRNLPRRRGAPLPARRNEARSPPNRNPDMITTNAFVPPQKEMATEG
ncbi:hypothetical protein BDV96DRAFT_577392 [Lophiotrema nucula]|uniref:F-box domain-containing protein n=1 Tax=Lophiotrema nucula TaxID=690887 RepID=A0A6A5Z4Q2_9PLEO|nr:hypothetical protein BDV96DRAFT_577392 [Lophiotrema nucula]